MKKVTSLLLLMFFLASTLSYAQLSKLSNVKQKAKTENQVIPDQKSVELAKLKAGSLKITSDENPNRVQMSSDATGDIVFSLDVEALTGDTQNLGCEYDGEFLWVTGAASSTDPNKLYKIDPVANTLVATYDQPASATGWGVRDLAWVEADGLIYGGATSFYSFDPVTEVWTELFASTIGTIRALAYDGTNFWTKSFSGPLYEFDVAGNTINTYTIAEAASCYGAAYDWNEGWLYLFSQDDAMFYQFDLAGNYQGVSYDVSAAQIGGIAGGAFFDFGNLVNSTATLGFALQGTPDIVAAMELYPSVVYTTDVGISSIVEPISGVDLTATEAVTITIKNYGTDPATDIPYEVIWPDPADVTVSDTWIGTLNPGETVDITLTEVANLSAYGDYLFEACTYYVGDENPANDCKAKTVTNEVPGYCDATTSTEDEWIANVLCGSIDNSSGWQGGVADYTAISTTIAQGMSQPIVVTNGNPWSSDKVTVWVDWNLDYEFGVGTDEEFVLLSDGTGLTFTGGILVPAGTPEGDYRMRVRMTYSVDPLPCGNSSYGEVEDYTIVVQAEVSCDLECPPEAIDEGEGCAGFGYVDTYNGGCNSDPEVYQDINLGDVICGTASTYLFPNPDTLIGDTLNYRDTDWYTFTTTESLKISWAIEAEFPAMIALMTNECGDWAYFDMLLVDKCVPGTLEAILPAGTYYAFVSPSVFSGYGCPAGDDIGDNTYIATLGFEVPSFGQLRGSVTDASTTLGIGGVEVSAGLFSAVTNDPVPPFVAGGDYGMLLPAGTYDVTFTHPDYYTYVEEGVVVFADSVYFQDANLEFIPPGATCAKAIEQPVNGPPVGDTLLPGEHWWYTFTLDEDYVGLNISACGSTFDTKLAVWADCDDFVGWPSSGQPAGVIGYNDDGCGLQSLINDSNSGLALPPVVPAGTYYVAVYGYSASSTGDYSLEIWGIPATQLAWIEGTVNDPFTKSPTEGVLITAAPFSATTGTDGMYEMAVEAGTYDVTAEKPGYDTQTITDVLVDPASTTTVDFDMEFAAPVLLTAEPTFFDVSLDWDGNPLFQGAKDNAAFGVSLGNRQEVPEKEAPTGVYTNPGGTRQGGDLIESAFVIDPPTLPYTNSGTTVGYNNDYDEACPYTGGTAPDVVYSFTPTDDLIVTISLCNSSYDTKLYLYENEYTPGSPYACNDDYCPGFMSEIQALPLTANNTYFIVVDGYGTSSGDYVLDMWEIVECVAVECPAEGIPEPEACGEDLNGGCNMEPGTEAWTPIACGDIYCGTVWADGTIKDTDWYEIVIEEVTDLTWHMAAEFDALAFIIDGNLGCEGLVILTSGTAAPCDTIVLTATVAPGTYWLWAGPSSSDAIECGIMNNYVAWLDCAPGFLPMYEVYRTTGTKELLATTFNTFYLDEDVAQGENYCYEIVQLATPEITLGPSNELCAYVPFPPAITVDPLELYETLDINQTSTQPLTVTNSGPGPLDWTATINYGTDNSKAVILEDNFDAYTAGLHLADQAGLPWTTWSNLPGSAEDPMVSADQAASAPNSFVVEAGNDCVLLLGDLTTGNYNFEFKMFVPTDHYGYFNILHLFDGNDSEWGLQVYFDTLGVGIVDADGAAAANFAFNYDEWIDLRAYVSLDNDWCDFYVNGELVVGYIWSQGTFGDPGLNQLGAANFYAWAENGTPKYYIDDMKLSEYEIIPWLTIDPTAGNIPADKGFNEINANFSSIDFDYGIYNADIIINSNDPVNPQITVPVEMVIGGILQGTVTGPVAKDNLKGVTITAEELRVSTITGDDGTYVMGLAPGNYRVTATKEGYATQTIENVVIVGGETNTVDFQMEFAAPVLLSATPSFFDVTLLWETNPLFVPVKDNSAGYLSLNNEMYNDGSFKKKEPQHGPTVIVPKGAGSRATGDDCDDPIVIPALPYEDINTTCGRGNTYEETCLGSYDGGEDIVYQLTLTEAKVIEFAFTSTFSWTGLLVTTECPIGANCVDYTTGSSGDKTLLLELEAGTYYIMMDTWPTPTCFDFTFTVTEVIPEPGETCGTAFDYGLVGDDAETGSIESYGVVWYSFTADQDYDGIDVSLCGSSFDTKLEVWLSCDSATYAWYNDDSNMCDGKATQSFIATGPMMAGDTWYAKVYGYSSNFGDYILEISETEFCVVECPPEGIPEPEVCGEDANGGCNMEAGTETWTPIACGDIYCGTAWADGSSRDTDWYEFAIETPKTITWSVKAEFPVLIFMIKANSGCTDYEIIASTTAMPCDTAELSAIVAPGAYWVLVMPSEFDGVACELNNNYVAELTCADAFMPFVEVYTVDADALIATVYGSNTYVDEDVVQGNEYCYYINEYPTPELMLGPSNIECATVPHMPVISVNPEELNESLNEGETSTQLLTVTNSGLGTLDFNVDVILFSDKSDNTITHPKATAPDASISGEHYVYEPTDPYMECMEGTIYGLLPDMDNGAATSEADPGYTCYQRIAAVGDFQTVGFWALNLVYDAGWSDCGTEDPMGFAIGFYENNPLSGEPGTLLYTEDVSLDRFETGEMLFDTYPLYYYEVTLASPVSMANGWISIQGLTSAEDCWFLWKGTTPASADHYLQLDEASQTFTVGDYPLSICLGGEASTPWLSVDPLFGTIVPDSDGFMELDANFNATGLEDGVYTADIVISSNDPLLPEIVVPVELIVGALTQEIIMPEGWNAWSSYINPDMRMGMEEVMAPVLDQMIITQHFSELFYPEFGINTMGDFTNAHGYVSKMTEEAVLPITGFMADATVALAAGWNLLPVISDCDVDVTELGLVPGFVIAWDIAGGGMYYPLYNINTIEYMVPGGAYYVKMNEAGSFTFLDCAPADGASANKPYRIENNTNWNAVNYTGVSHAVIFNEFASADLLTGDIIGAFTADGQCAGIAEVVTGSTGLKAFADDFTTLSADGFVEGETLSYKLYRPATGDEFILSVTYDVQAPNADGLFAVNGLSVVTDLTMTVTGVNVQALNGLSIYPNPSDGIFNVSITNLDQDINYVIVNAKGQAVLEAKLLETQEVDLSAEPKGVYFIKFINDDVLRIEKVVIK